MTSLPSVGFVGGGRVARILVGGWRHAGVAPGHTIVCEPDATAANRLRSVAGELRITEGDFAAAARQDVLFLAVHPPLIAEVAQQLQGVISAPAIVVSLAPKFTLAKLGELLGGAGRLARTIPNAPSIVGCGFNPVCWGPQLEESGRNVVRQLLKPLGQCPEVPEPTLEAYAIISAMGPTYFWPQWAELARLAQEFGLTPDDARTAVKAMIAGAAETLFDASLATEEVLDLIPVKPLADFEPTLRDAYRTRLMALREKLRP